MTSPANWYPDPSGKPMQRYFDGTEWTEHYAAWAAPAATPPQQVPSLQHGLSRGARVWLALGAVAVVVVLAVLGLSPKAHNASHSSDPPSVPPSAHANGLFQEVRDGQFAFIVNSTTTGDVPHTTPMGEWALIAITVTNIGDRPQSFFPQNQKLIDSSGREYAADTMAAAAMNDRATIVDMNPGFSVKLWIPFDVPPGTDLAAIQLHDSAFSSGATVTI